jgi:predicted transcriptional regulator YdeE
MKIMQTKRVYKDTFAIIGKAGEGSAANAGAWIAPLWQDANAHFGEIAALIRRNENGAPLLWGGMNDVSESNKIWGERGKYIAGCEADLTAQPPVGWQKWIIPAQTYLVAECTQDTYGEVFSAVLSDPDINIIATVHECYPQTKPDVMELWFPVEEGK